MKLSKVLSFAFVATMAMQTLDIIGHLTTITWGGEIIKPETAVHLPYIAIKITVVLLVLAFFTYFMGIGMKKGLLGAFTATTIFDIYYRFAEPTLDRSVFTLDEKSVVWIVFHAICLLVPYWLLTKYVLEKPEYEGKAYVDPKAARNKLGIAAVLSLIASVIVLSASKAFLKKSGFFFAFGPVALHFNEYVLIGTLFLIIAVTFFYKVIALSRSHE